MPISLSRCPSGPLPPPSSISFPSRWRKPTTCAPPPCQSRCLLPCHLSVCQVPTLVNLCYWFVSVCVSVGVCVCVWIIWPSHGRHVGFNLPLDLNIIISVCVDFSRLHWYNLLNKTKEHKQHRLPSWHISVQWSDDDYDDSFDSFDLCSVSVFVISKWVDNFFPQIYRSGVKKYIYISEGEKSIKIMLFLTELCESGWLLS